MWEMLKKKGFKYLCLRRINQDPLENFFGRIRSHGVRNVNPTCYSFICAYKSLIINNFSSCHSINANCEDDENSVLDNLKCLLTDSSEDNFEENTFDDSLVYNSNSPLEPIDNNAVIVTHSYIAGFLAKKKNVVGNCPTCMNQLQATKKTDEHTFISDMEYGPNRLISPKTQFRRTFSNMSIIFMQNIKQYILEKAVKKKLSIILKKKLYNPFLCKNHNVFDVCIDLFLFFYLNRYLKNINLVLKGQTSLNLKEDDYFKKLAWQRFLSLKSKKGKIQLMKQITIT